MCRALVGKSEVVRKSSEKNVREYYEKQTDLIVCPDYGSAVRKNVAEGRLQFDKYDLFNSAKNGRTLKRRKKIMKIHSRLIFVSFLVYCFC